MTSLHNQLVPLGVQLIALKVNFTSLRQQLVRLAKQLTPQKGALIPLDWQLVPIGVKLVHSSTSSEAFNRSLATERGSQVTAAEWSTRGEIVSSMLKVSPVHA